MNKKGFFVAFVYLAFIVLLASLGSFIAINSSGDSVVTNYTKVNIVMKRVALHDYIPDVYDCTEFSNELIKELHAINISAYCVAGRFNSVVDGSLKNHAWVRAEIDGREYDLDAQTGNFFRIEDYEKYTPIWEGATCIF